MHGNSEYTGRYCIDQSTVKNIFQLKRELVVSCCGELIALHTEIANLIVDVASVIDTETQVRISRLRYCTVQ